MRVVVRFVAIAIVVVVGLCWCQPDSAEAVASFVDGCVQTDLASADQSRDLEDSDAVFERNTKRAALKECVIRDLIEGRSDFDYAIEAFIEFKGGNAKLVPSLRQKRYIAKEVLSQAEALVTHMTAPRDETLARLHCNFEDYCDELRAEAEAESSASDDNDMPLEND